MIRSRSRGHRRLAARLVAVLAAALLAMLGTAGPALAHNVLISSDPADGAQLDSAPETVSFTFDQPIQDYGPQLKIFGPDGNDFAADKPTIRDTVISAPMLDGPAGTYRAVYRIVSADGHPVTGEISFTLTEAAAGTATGTPPSSGAAVPNSSTGQTESPAGESTGGSGKIWLGIGIAVAAVAVLAAVVLALRPPHQRRPE